MQWTPLHHQYIILGASESQLHESVCMTSDNLLYMFRHQQVQLQGRHLGTLSRSVGNPDQLTEAWKVKLWAEKKHRRCRGLRFDSRRVRCARSHARVPLCVQEEITSIKPLIKQIGGWLVNERRPSGELLIREAISACQEQRMRRRRSLRDYYSARLPIQRPHHRRSSSLAESFCTRKQI